MRRPGPVSKEIGRILETSSKYRVSSNVVDKQWAIFDQNDVVEPWFSADSVI